MDNISNLIEEKINNNQDVLIMAVGDSITYGMNHCTVEETYCAELCKLFAKKYPKTLIVRYDGIVNGEFNPLKEYFGPIVINEGENGSITIVKSGVGGNTVRRALNRSDDYTGKFLNGKMPDIFLLMFGINDALQDDKNKFVTPDKFFEDYNELYNLLKNTNSNAKIILMTPTYNDTGMYETSGLEPYCEMVKKLAIQKGCFLIDTHKLWMEHLIIGSEHYGQREWLSGKQGDSCHFSPEGSKATAQFIFSELLK